MEQKEKCNLIEDLLPLYIEELVSEKTKNEIKHHLENCDKCLESFNRIKNEKNIFDNDEISEFDEKSVEREIRCIKNIKRRIFLKTIIIIIICICMTATIFHIFNTYRLVRDENGRYILYNFNTGNIKKGDDSTNVYAKYINNNNGRNIEYDIILTFDKNNICINARCIIKGYNETEMENFRKSWESSIVISNIKIENKKIYMNDNTYIGRDKDKILKNLRNDYNAEIIEI